MDFDEFKGFLKFTSQILLLALLVTLLVVALVLGLKSCESRQKAKELQAVMTNTTWFPKQGDLVVLKSDKSTPMNVAYFDHGSVEIKVYDPVSGFSETTVPVACLEPYVPQKQESAESEP